MSLNTGLGAVVQKNHILLNDSLVPGRITACKHANGRDWWIFAHKLYSNTVYEYLVTPNGIQGPFIQNLITRRDIGVGQFIFSNDGGKFVYYEPYDDLEIGDFDRCSGAISNVQHFDINDTAYTAGAAYSNSGRFLYISSMNYIYQYDLYANNIDSSRVTVAAYDGYRFNSLQTVFYIMSNAPDGKIYLSTGNSTPYLHVINNPDSIGLACNVCQHCISLPRYNAFTMPNFPNYFLGAEGNSICDSLPTIVSSFSQKENNFEIFPNPTHNDLYIEVKGQKIESVALTNSLGQNIPFPYDVIKNEYLHLNVSTLESGIYFLSFMTDEKRVVRKFVRE